MQIVPLQLINLLVYIGIDLLKIKEYRKNENKFHIGHIGNYEANDIGQAKIKYRTDLLSIFFIHVYKRQQFIIKELMIFFLKTKDKDGADSCVSFAGIIH